MKKYCPDCVSKAKARRIAFDKIVKEAQGLFKIDNEKKAVCKIGIKGKFFICAPREAFAKQYTILEIISELPQVPA